MKSGGGHFKGLPMFGGNGANGHENITSKRVDKWVSTESPQC